MSNETKVLSAPVGRGQKREPTVSQKEWSAIFSEYPDPIRYHAANLAAHNWYVVMVEGRIMIGHASSNSCHWIDKDGSREPLSPEEKDTFFPRHDGPSYWPKHSRDTEARCWRQAEIVLPTTTIDT